MRPRPKKTIKITKLYDMKTQLFPFSGRDVLFMPLMGNLEYVSWVLVDSSCNITSMSSETAQG